MSISVRGLKAPLSADADEPSSSQSSGLLSQRRNLSVGFRLLAVEPYCNLDFFVVKFGIK